MTADLIQWLFYSIIMAAVLAIVFIAEKIWKD